MTGLLGGFGAIVGANFGMGHAPPRARVGAAEPRKRMLGRFFRALLRVTPQTWWIVTPAEPKVDVGLSTSHPRVFGTSLHLPECDKTPRQMFHDLRPDTCLKLCEYSNLLSSSVRFLIVGQDNCRLDDENQHHGFTWHSNQGGKPQEIPFLCLE